MSEQRPDSVTNSKSVSDLDGPGIFDFLSAFFYHDIEDPLKIFSKFKNEYGSTVYFNASDFGGDALLLSDPEIMEQVLLKRQKEFGKPDSPATKDVREIMGNSILTTDGEEWRRQHRILMPHFQDNAVEQMVPTLNEVTNEFVERLSSDTLEKPFDLFKETKRVGLRFICRALFSYEMSDSEINDVRGCIDTLRSAYRARRQALVTTPFWFPTPTNQRAKRARDTLYDFTETLIETRRNSRNRPEDLLTTMLDACDDNETEGLSPDEVQAEIVTFIIAGYTTTAAAMGWSIYELLRHPSAYERVRAEATEAWEANDVESIPDSIPFTDAVFNESLRLYPTAPWISRAPTDDIQINGLEIPEGTPVIMSPYLLHHDSNHFDDPESFRPERFLGDDPPEAMRYLPFSVGAHQCIGREIAMLEGPFILSKIFAHGQVKRVPETPDRVDIHTAVNIEPDRPVPVAYEFSEESD